MLVGKKQNIYSYLAHRYALFLWVLDVEIYRVFFIGPALKVLSMELVPPNKEK